jgi:hypothetical protein
MCLLNIALLGGEPAAKKPLMQGTESVDCSVYNGSN